MGDGTQVDAARKDLTDLLPDYVESHFSCSKAKLGYSGTCVLLRHRPLAVTCEKLEGGEDEGRTICVELADLFLVLCYVPNSGDGLVRLQERVGEWDGKLRDYLRSLKARGKPVVLMGDLNVAD